MAENLLAMYQTIRCGVGLAGVACACGSSNGGSSFAVVAKSKLHEQSTPRQTVSDAANRPRLATHGGSTMHHHILENELLHLERVIAWASQKPFPPTYWRDRIEHLKSSPQAPMYHKRLDRLSRLVAELSE